MDRYGFVKCHVTFHTKNKIIPVVVFIKGTLFRHDDWDGILAETKAEMANDPLARVFLKPDDFIIRIDVVPLVDKDVHSYFFDINKTVREIVCEAIEKEPFKTVFNVHFIRPSGTPDVINFITKDRSHWEYGTRSKIIEKAKELIKNRNSCCTMTNDCLIYRIDIDKDKRIMPLDHSEMFYVIDIFNEEKEF